MDGCLCSCSLFSFSQSSNRSSIRSHLWALYQWSLRQGPGVWISTCARRVQTTAALLTHSKTCISQCKETSQWMCVISFADGLLRGGRPARRRSFWIRPMRTCGMTSDRLPRRTGRSGSTSWAGSSRAWPWSRSGEQNHHELWLYWLFLHWWCGNSLNVI